MGACLSLGLRPKMVVSERVDFAWLVIDSINRTSYTSAQRTLIAARLLEPLEAEARARQGTAGKPLPKKFRKGEAAEIAAKAVGKTNAPYVREARG
jgi:hypothetical protein